IRDATVTGVQTCALPISGQEVARHETAGPGRSGPMRAPSPFWSRLKGALTALRPRHAAAMVAIACILGALAYAFTEDRPEGSIQIGRASCRERDGNGRSR